MYSFFGLLYDNIGTLLCYIIMLLAKILIWAPFLQLMCTFSFCINPWKLSSLGIFLFKYIHWLYYLQSFQFLNTSAVPLYTRSH